MILLGVSTDWRPYAALSAWLGVGLVYYAIRGMLGGVGTWDATSGIGAKGN